LVAPELRFNDAARDSFDRWGGRLYVLLRDYSVWKYDERQARPPQRLWQLALSEPALHDLGVKWVVSALRLTGPARLSFLNDEGTYGDPDAGCVLYLYRVRDPLPRWHSAGAARRHFEAAPATAPQPG
jgi:hypothetical protein